MQDPDFRSEGSWVVFIYDPNPKMITHFKSEIDALRYALDFSSQVVFVPYGVRIEEAIKAEDDKRKNS